MQPGAGDTRWVKGIGWEEERLESKKKPTTYFHRLNSLLETGGGLWHPQVLHYGKRSLEPTCEINLVYLALTQSCLSHLSVCVIPRGNASPFLWKQGFRQHSGISGKQNSSEIFSPCQHCVKENSQAPYVTSSIISLSHENLQNKEC